MNPYLRFLIFIAIDIYIFKNFGKLYGFIGLGIILYRLLNTLGITRSPTIYKAAFRECRAYLKDYQGSYKNPDAYKEACNLLKSLGLKEFGVIGIFYDRPGEVPEDKLRYSVGIYKLNKGFPDPPTKELEKYCNDNNYYMADLPSASSIYSDWEFSNSFTMMMGIIKFYKKLNNNLSDPSFRQTYKLSKEFKPKVCIEIFKSEAKLEFHVPYVDADKFLVYKKEDDKPKSQ